MKTHENRTLNDMMWLKIILILAAFFIQFVTIAIIFNPSSDEYIKMRIANFLIKIIIIITTFVFTKYIDKRKLSFLGIKFEKNRSIKLFGIGCIIVLCQLTIIDTITYFLKFVEKGYFNFSFKILFMGIGIFAIHTIFTGISEEMLFRGYILGNLLTRYSEFKGVIISSILFTIIHVSSQQTIIDYLDIFLMGIILAELFLISGSLYLPIGVHFISDFIQEEIFRVIAVNENPYAVIKFNITNDVLINGSTIGSKIEILFVISEIIILMFIYNYNKKFNILNMIKP